MTTYATCGHPVTEGLEYQIMYKEPAQPESYEVVCATCFAGLFHFCYNRNVFKNIHIYLHNIHNWGASDGRNFQIS